MRRDLVNETWDWWVWHIWMRHVSDECDTYEWDMRLINDSRVVNELMKHSSVTCRIYMCHIMCNDHFFLYKNRKQKKKKWVVNELMKHSSVTCRIYMCHIMCNDHYMCHIMYNDMCHILYNDAMTIICVTLCTMMNIIVIAYNMTHIH